MTVDKNVINSSEELLKCWSAGKHPSGCAKRSKQIVAEGKRTVEWRAEISFFCWFIGGHPERYSKKWLKVSKVQMGGLSNGSTICSGVQGEEVEEGKGNSSKGELTIAPSDRVTALVEFDAPQRYVMTRVCKDKVQGWVKLLLFLQHQQSMSFHHHHRSDINQHCTGRLITCVGEENGQ